MYKVNLFCKMNEYFSQSLNLLRNEVIYSPLTEDSEIFDTSIKFSSTSSNLNLKFLKTGRNKLFQNNQTFKINRKNSNSKNKKGRIRTFLNEFQEKIQIWSQVRN